jgi:hypothetical protein
MYNVGKLQVNYIELTPGRLDADCSTHVGNSCPSYQPGAIVVNLFSLSLTLRTYEQWPVL